MLARDIMTNAVVTVTPDVRVDDVARLFLKHHISGVPVVNAENEVLGIVSEGDLMRRAETGRERHRSWWLSAFHKEFQQIVEGARKAGLPES
jgi:CBS domain-containing protein